MKPCTDLGSKVFYPLFTFFLSDCHRLNQCLYFFHNYLLWLLFRQSLVSAFIMQHCLLVYLPVTTCQPPEPYPIVVNWLISFQYKVIPLTFTKHYGICCEILTYKVKFFQQNNCKSISVHRTSMLCKYFNFFLLKEHMWKTNILFRRNEHINQKTWFQGCISVRKVWDV